MAREPSRTCNRFREDLGVLTSRAETFKSKLQYAAAFENKYPQLKREAADLQIKLQDEHKRDEDRMKRRRSWSTAPLANSTTTVQAT